MIEIAPGDWFLMPEGRVVRVTEVSGSPPQVLAEVPGGSSVERPIENVRKRWRRLPSDGFRARLATDRSAVETLVDSDPVGLIAMALADQGGTATTRELKVALGMLLGARLPAWWKRTQIKLDDDERIDTADALGKRYRLLREGETPRSRQRPLLSGETRLGLALLDGPRLERARERSKSGADRAGMTDSEFMSVAEKASDESIDPTDRFMAGEVAVNLGRWSESELAERLGDSVVKVDLLRIPDHASRERALRLAEARWPGGPDVPAFLSSAVAVGGRWRSEALRLSDARQIPKRTIVAKGIAWSAPGSEEAGKPDHPNDLHRYATRLDGLTGLLRASAHEGSGEQARSLLRALSALMSRKQRGVHWDRCVGLIATAYWDPETDEGVARALNALSSYPPEEPEVWSAIVEEAPQAATARLKGLLETAYARDEGTLPALVRYAHRFREPLLPWLLGLARSELSRTEAQRMVLDALMNAGDDPGAAADGVTLAGTIWPNHPLVSERLDRMAEEARASLVDGIAPQGGSVLLRSAAWQRLVAETHRLIADAISERDAAVSAQAELQARLEEQSRVHETRREALAEVRTQRAQEDATATRRVAVSLMKPVAAALDDSLESGSLASLQDFLRAALARLRIHPIAEVGQVLDFDPDRHTWVGEGYPSPKVCAITCGFAAEMEDEGEIILSFARVGPVTD